MGLDPFGTTLGPPWNTKGKGIHSETLFCRLEAVLKGLGSHLGPCLGYPEKLSGASQSFSCEFWSPKRVQNGDLLFHWRDISETMKIELSPAREPSRARLKGLCWDLFCFFFQVSRPTLSFAASGQPQMDIGISKSCAEGTLGLIQGLQKPW